MSNVRLTILYETGVVAKLAKRFGVSDTTVRAALRFATEGERPDLIRMVALKEYGCVLRKKPIIIRDLKTDNKDELV